MKRTALRIAKPRAARKSSWEFATKIRRTSVSSRCCANEGMRSLRLSPPAAQRLHQPGRPFYALHPGKEIVMRIVFTIAALALFCTALVGCRAEGEIGDTSSTISNPR